jgi:NAD(P)-dependent dehydrogenase (short-subunit alcohol dehydrogenase family)
MNVKLSNKVALITGGTSGIGLETAKLFRDEGARVIVTGAEQGRLDAASRELGSSVLVLRADLRVPGELDNVFDQIRQRFGHLDILFANAGIGLAAPLEAVTEKQIDEQFAINFKGVFFTVQKAAPLLAKGGSIVLTTSFLNAVGTPGLSILSATKAAVRSLARSLAAELAPRGIRVNAVSPGPISTPLHSKLGLSQGELKEAATGIEAQVPLHRFGEAGEIAKAALFLASEDASFATGSELVVDGEWSQRIWGKSRRPSMTESTSATPKPQKLQTQNRRGPLPKLKKSQIARALVACAGNVIKAAMKLRCDRRTIYRAFERYPDLLTLRADVRESLCDLADDVVVEKILDRDVNVALAFLKRFSPKWREARAPREVVIRDERLEKLRALPRQEFLLQTANMEAELDAIAAEPEPDAIDEA